MSKTEFYICNHCKNLVGMIHNAGVPIMCCGEKMEKLSAGSVDASYEKHVPVVKIESDCVTVDVGSVSHPMQSEHHIAWVYLQTDKGGQIKYLKTDSDPIAAFALCDENPKAVYAYCNLHGLWKTEI